MKNKVILDLDRVSAREKLSKTEKKLSGIIYERGVNEISVAIIRSEGIQEYEQMERERLLPKAF